MKWNRNLRKRVWIDENLIYDLSDNLNCWGKDEWYGRWYWVN